MTGKLIVFEAGRTNDRYWRDLWMSRQLIWILALRDISIRYKQTALGLAWSLMRPVVTMTVFTIVFQKIAGLPSDGNLPYSLMVLAGMVPWILFSASLPDVANSLTSNASLIEKVFFPRLVMPLSALSNAILEFLISIALLSGLMIVYGVPFTAKLAFLPLFATLPLFASVGVGLWCAAINVRYRDIKFIVPFALQAGMYLTPIGYSSHLVPEQWKPIFYLNPMATAVDGFRWVISGGSSSLYMPGLAICVLMCCALLLGGAYYFRKMERTFADYI